MPRHSRQLARGATELDPCERRMLDAWAKAEPFGRRTPVLCRNRFDKSLAR